MVHADLLCFMILQITLHQPEEYLVQVKGTLGKLAFGEGITSLTFITNKGIHGPYGCPTPNTFESPSGQKVTGFFGRSGMYLDQLGIFCDMRAGTKTVSGTRIVEGPWGGVGGSSFYDGVGDIVEMVVLYSDTHILSFQTSYGHSGLGFTTGFRGQANPDSTKVRYIHPLFIEYA